MLNKLLNVLISSVCLLFLSASCFAQFKHPPTASEERALRTFLQGYAGDSDEKKTTRYDSAFVDLNSDGAREVIVLLSGNGWCGSGGCTMLVLTPEASTYRIVTKITVTRSPIRVLKSTSNGWRDISVQVRGGGILPGHEAELRFDGTSYPTNPSAPPARELNEKRAGEVVVSYEGQGTPLYP
jgi:hypothetical protein